MKRLILNTIPSAIKVKTIPVVSGSNKWIGGSLVGDYIYGAPHFSADILKINTLNDSVSYIPTGLGGTARYAGAVTSPNGFIYFVQGDASGIMKLDPSDDSLTFITAGTGLDKFAGGVLAPNGFIYFIPRSYEYVVKLDPTTDLVTNLSTSYTTAQYKWWGGVLGENGIIYGIPRNSDSILRIDPTTDSTSLIPLVAGSDKYIGGNLSYNGLAYFFPRNANNVCEFDPSTETFSFLSLTLTGSNKSSGSQLTPNGKILCPPFGLTTALLKKESNNFSYLLEGGSGLKSWGAVMSRNGDIYSIPFAGNSIYKYSNFGEVESSMYTIPVDLNDLPTSEYNKFYNKF